MRKTIEESSRAELSSESRLLKELASLQSNVDQVEELRQQNTTLREEKSALDQKLSGSESAVSKLHKELEILRVNEMTLKSWVAETEARAMASPNTHDTLREVVNTLASTQAQNGSLGTQLQRTKGDLDDAASKLVGAALLEQDLRGQIAELRHEIDEARNGIKSLESDREEFDRMALINLEAVRASLCSEAEKTHQEQKAGYETALQESRNRQSELEIQLGKSIDKSRSEMQIEHLRQQICVKDKDIAGLEAAQATANEKIRRLERSIQQDNSNTQIIKNLRDDLELLSTECRSRNDSLRALNADKRSADQKLEHLQRQYQILQTQSENTRRQRIGNPVKELADVQKIRDREQHTATQDRQNAEDTTIRPGQQSALPKKASKDHAEILQRLDETDRAEKAVKPDGIKHKEAEIGMYRKTREMHMDTDSKAVPETQLMGARSPQPLHPTSQQSGPPQPGQPAIPPSHKAGPKENQNIVHPQTDCIAEDVHSSRTTNLPSTLQSERPESHQIKPPFFSLGNFGNHDEEHGASFHHPHEPSSFPIFPSLNGNRPHSSSMLSDASPSTPEDIPNLRNQQARNSNLQAPLLPRTPSKSEKNNSSPEKTSGRTIVIDIPISQKGHLQRVSTRPNTGSKVARHQTPSETQERQVEYQNEASFAPEQGNDEFVEWLGSSGLESTESSEQHQRTNESQRSTASINETSSLTNSQPKLAQNQKQTYRSSLSRQRTPVDEQSPGTPGAHIAPVKHPKRYYPPTSAAIDSLSPGNIIRENLGGSQKRRAADEAEQNHEQISKRLRSSQKLPTQTSGLPRVSASKRGNIVQETSIRGLPQDTQIKESTSQNQAIDTKQPELHSEYFYTRDKYRVSKSTSQVKGGNGQSQEQGISKAESSRSQRPQINASESQSQSQSAHDSSTTGRSRIRSSGRGSQTSSHRASQRGKKDKKRYQTRFSQELRGG